MPQKIWLDDAYIEQRELEEEWIEPITSDFGRWIINAYEFLCKDSFIMLGDDELRELNNLTEEAILADKEFFK